MNARNDLERQLAAFLQEGVSELPDRAFAAIRAGTNRTRQRVVLGPWREPRMISSFRLAAVAAAVVLGVAGLALIGRPPGPAAPSPIASPTAVATSPASSTPPTAAPSGPALYTWPNPLPAGSYSTALAWDLDFEIRFTVPEGWESRDIEVVKDEASVSFQLVAGLASDPCATPPTQVDPGSSVEDLATALARDAAISVTEPAAIEVAGASGLSLSYAAAADVTCVGDTSVLWASPADRILPYVHLGPPSWPLRAGSHTVRILDVGGTRLVIDATAGSAPTAELEAEVQAIVDSVAFGPITHSISIGFCTLEISRHGTPLGSGPYTATLGPNVPTELRGPIPAPFPLQPPLDWLDFTGSGWQAGQGKPGGFHLVPPPGAASEGFATSTTVDGYQGSWVFDTAGTWWVRFTGNASSCVQQLPILVEAGT